MLPAPESELADGSPLLRGLYPIADADAAEKAGLNLRDCCLAMLSVDLPLVQLRAKGRSSAQVSAVLSAIQGEVGASFSRLIVNDRADLAELHGTAGVHVGQADLSVPELREHFPRLLCGVSTHSLHQLDAQLALGPDYVAFGPIYSTSSKLNPEPVVGADLLARAAQSARLNCVPLVAIGGISEETLVDVARLAEMVALISLIFPPPGTHRPYAWMEKRCQSLNDQVRAQRLSGPS